MVVAVEEEEREEEDPQQINLALFSFTNSECLY